MKYLSDILTKIKRKLNTVEYWRSRGCKIGSNCEIYPSANLGSEPYLISIGNHVRITDGVQLITHDGGMWVLRELLSDFNDADCFGKIVIGNNVHIGINAIIMPGVTIGSNVVVGCGAVVVKDIPSNTIAAGVPARNIENIDEYLEKHINDIDHTKKLSLAEKRKYLIDKYL